MKHRGERSIPDFSTKRKPPHGVSPEREEPRAPVPKRVSQPKPHATSAKSGRRGQ